jgi:hypothetical protein
MISITFSINDTTGVEYRNVAEFALKVSKEGY